MMKLKNPNRSYLQGAFRMYSVAIDRMKAAVNNEEITMEELKDRTGLTKEHLDRANELRINNAYKLATDRYNLAIKNADDMLRNEVKKGNLSESDYKTVTGKNYETTAN